MLNFNLRNIYLSTRHLFLIYFQLYYNMEPITNLLTNNFSGFENDLHIAKPNPDTIHLINIIELQLILGYMFN